MMVIVPFKAHETKGLACNSYIAVGTGMHWSFVVREEATRWSLQHMWSRVINVVT